MDTRRPPIIYCHFCGRSAEDAHLLLRLADMVAICDECVEICRLIVVKLERAKDWERLRHFAP